MSNKNTIQDLKKEALENAKYNCYCTLPHDKVMWLIEQNEYLEKRVAYEKTQDSDRTKKIDRFQTYAFGIVFTIYFAYEAITGIMSWFQ